MMTFTTTRPVAALRSDAEGSVAMIFGLSFTAFLLLVGVAIDYSRAVHTQARLSAAMDAATLASGRALLEGQLEDSEIKERALALIKENYESSGHSFAELDVSSDSIVIDRNSSGIVINTRASVPTTLTAITGLQRLNVAARSAATFNQQDIELGLQLDITGSMSGQKLADLKRALNGVRSDAYNAEPEDQGLFDVLLAPDGTNKVRIGLAPYSAGVNLGVAQAASVTGNRNAGSGCVYDRASGVEGDDPARSGSYFKGRADLSGAQMCPNATVTPLSRPHRNDEERERLKGVVRTYQAGGTTAGQVGTNWAWNLISPKWNGFWATDPVVPYGDANTVKAVILMTDGEYNTVDGRCDNSGCTPYGTRGRRSNEAAKQLCQKMKSEGVIVYTVGFQLNHPVAIATLGECASSSQTAFLANDGEELRRSFRDIASQLNNLRLTQ